MVLTSYNALLERVIPYFGVTHLLLSDWDQEFTNQIWSELLPLLGIQYVLTSPYHPERNVINKRNHRVIENIMQAFLQEGSLTTHWVDKLHSIMLTLNSMPHGPHGHSAPMVDTEHENALQPDLVIDDNFPSPAKAPSSYLTSVKSWLRLVHGHAAPSEAPITPNPYHEDDLIWVTTTFPEWTSKLAPR